MTVRNNLDKSVCKWHSCPLASWREKGRNVVCLVIWIQISLVWSARCQWNHTGVTSAVLSSQSVLTSSKRYHTTRSAFFCLIYLLLSHLLCYCFLWYCKTVTLGLQTSLRVRWAGTEGDSLCLKDWAFSLISVRSGAGLSSKMLSIKLSFLLDDILELLA